MRRIRSAIVTTTLLAAAVLATPGCADNESMLFVQGVVSLRGNTTCVVSPDPSTPIYANGVLDVALRRSYEAVLLVGNQVTARGSREELKTETSRITLRGAEVTLRDSQDAELTSFTVPAAGFAPESDGVDPGYGLVAATLVPASQGTSLAGGLGAGASTTITAAVKVFGRTLGGTEVESGEYLFPIVVCNACLISFPPEAIDPVTGQCTASDNDTVALPCASGQDQPVDCRLCARSNAQCR